MKQCSWSVIMVALTNVWSKYPTVVQVNQGIDKSYIVAVY